MSTAAAARLAAYWPTYVQPACSSLLSRDTCNINNNTANRSADRSASEVFYQANVATGSSFSSRRRPKVYSSQTLRHLRKTRSCTLPNSVVELLRQLSLLHRRGCRGAGSVRRAINVSRAIPVITRPRRHQPRQSAAARTSVLSRPPTARLPTTATAPHYNLVYSTSAHCAASQRLSVTSYVLNDVMYSLSSKLGTTTRPVRRCCCPARPTTTSSNVQDPVLLPATSL